MKYEPVLKKATFLRRYKRFLADVSLAGETLTVHCPNTGSMTNCLVEGSDCWLWDSQNASRKYRFSWELATTQTGGLACINTLRANALVEEALKNGKIEPLLSYRSWRREVPIGEKSRIDFLLEEAGLPSCYVEVKSVTLGEEGGLGMFPDAKSVRACKHLKELMRVCAQVDKAVLLYCVLHEDITHVKPAVHVDPEYASLLAQAKADGVEVLAYRGRISTNGLEFGEALPVSM